MTFILPIANSHAEFLVSEKVNSFKSSQVHLNIFKFKLFKIYLTEIFQQFTILRVQQTKRKFYHNNVEIRKSRLCAQRVVLTMKVLDRSMETKKIDKTYKSISRAQRENLHDHWCDQNK